MENEEMKAAVVRAFKQPLTIEDVAKPEPGVGEIVVKIEASGLCHTDIHAAHGDWPVKPKLPFIPATREAGSSRASWKASPRSPWATGWPSRGSAGRAEPAPELGAEYTVNASE